MAGWLGGVFTRDERMVVVFLAVSLTVGSLVMASRRVDPSLMAPESGPLPDSVAAVAPAAEPPAWPVDVNRATAEELEALPGIGPARAAAIVALRERRGGLGSLEDLLDVKGIGPKTLERLRPFAVAGSRADSSRGAGAGTAPGEGRT